MAWVAMNQKISKFFVFHLDAPELVMMVAYAYLTT